MLARRNEAVLDFTSASSSHKIKRQCGFTIYSTIDWMNNTITNSNKKFWMEHMFPSISDFTSGLKYEDLLLMPKFLHLCQMRSDKNYSVWLPNYWWWPKYASDSSCFTSGQFWILSLALVSSEINAMIAENMYIIGEGLKHGQWPLAMFNARENIK